MKSNWTTIAQAGYNGAENPHLWSSDLWLVHEAGAYMQRTGRGNPLHAKKSRGYTVKINDMTFKWVDDSQIPGETNFVRLD